jgi:ribonuclease G
MPSELFLSRFGGHTWAALREDGHTVELRVEREGDAPAVGRIVRARVTRVLPGLQSAFVDLGLARDAFLHVADLLLPGEQPPPDAESVLARAADDDVSDEDAGGRTHAPAIQAPIQDRLRPGRELLVQIAREGFGSKGPRVTCLISLPGRYLVYLPQMAHGGVSRRISDPEERARLKAALEELTHVPGAFIARTAAAGAEAGLLRADAERLAAAWDRCQRTYAGSSAPAVVHQDVDLFFRLLRDAPRAGLERIVVEGAADRERAVAYLADVDPQLAARVRLHPGPAPLFESHGLDEDVARALRPRVWLRSGGTVVIEPTEALVAIDVNTGKYVGRGQLEDTVLQTNLEAAEEIARQLRLRDLGGIVVVDFIDMEQPESKRKVLEALEAALARDRARTKVVGLSDLGLVQLTRKRTRRGIAAALTRTCPGCAGLGRIKNAPTIASEALFEIRRLLSETEASAVTVRTHPEVARLLALELQTGGEDLDAVRRADVRIEADASVAPDHFEIVASRRASQA